MKTFRVKMRPEYNRDGMGQFNEDYCKRLRALEKRLQVDKMRFAGVDAEGFEVYQFQN